MVDADVVGLLRTVVRRGRALDLRRYEGSGSEELLTTLVPRLLCLVQALADGLRAVAMEEVETAPATADLAFMARIELQGVRERLAGLSGCEPERVLGECSAAQRTLLRAGRAVVEALVGGRRSRRSAELAMALRLRAAYAALRRELQVDEEPHPDQVRDAVRTLSDRLGTFVAGPAFAEARIEDRMQLRALHERMQAWLVASGEPRLGLRLWQDAATCAALIGRINLRSELVEHDRALVADAARWLARPEPPRKVPERLRNRLSRLYGRDPTVDALLEAKAQLTESWRAPLQRLHAELEPALARTA